MTPALRALACAASLLVAAAAQAGADVRDLPLVEAPVAAPGDVLVVLLTGDGGWASMDRATAAAFGAAGVPVVGLDSLRYFWHRRSPDEASHALGRILDHYTATWQRRSVVLVGFSFGADVLPFLATRLAPAQLARVRLVALVGPSPEADFEIHVADWIRDVPPPNALPLEPEVRALAARGPRILCVRGAAEQRSLCPALRDVAVLDVRPGAHHLDRDWDAVVRRILAELRAASSARPSP